MVHGCIHLQHLSRFFSHFWCVDFSVLHLHPRWTGNKNHCNYQLYWNNAHVQQNWQYIIMKQSHQEMTKATHNYWRSTYTCKPYASKHVHKHAHTYMHVMHTHTQPCTNVCMHACTHTHTHTHTHTSNTNTHTHMHIQRHTDRQTDTDTHSPLYLHFESPQTAHPQIRRPLQWWHRGVDLSAQFPPTCEHSAEQLETLPWCGQG